MKSIIGVWWRKPRKYRRENTESVSSRNGGERRRRSGWRRRRLINVQAKKWRNEEKKAWRNQRLKIRNMKEIMAKISKAAWQRNRQKK